jgi:hypothetical protein
MIHAEMEKLPLVHAIDKLFECYGMSRESVDKQKFVELCQGLRSTALTQNEMAFKKLAKFKQSEQMTLLRQD